MLGAEKHTPPAPCGVIPLDLRRLEIKKIKEFSLTEHRRRKSRSAIHTAARNRQRYFVYPGRRTAFQKMYIKYSVKTFPPECLSSFPSGTFNQLDSADTN